jgi:hypothetical protein
VRGQYAKAIITHPPLQYNVYGGLVVGGLDVHLLGRCLLILFNPQAEQIPADIIRFTHSCQHHALTTRLRCCNLSSLFAFLICTALDSRVFLALSTPCWPKPTW